MSHVDLDIAQPVADIPFADLTGSPAEIELRRKVNGILKHHKVLNGALSADLVAMFLALSQPAPVQVEATVQKVADMKLTDEMTDYEFHEVLFADVLDEVILEARAALAKETGQ